MIGVGVCVLWESIGSGGLAVAVSLGGWVA